MFKSILSFGQSFGLGFGQRSNRQVVEAVYEAIVAAARQPRFYSHWNVPDTPLGRYEMLSLHMVLFLERARTSGPALAGLAQEVTDEFFKDVDHSLRELGINDISMPKRMKKLAKMFYGRAQAYREALVADDAAALAAAFARNVQPQQPAWPEAADLAAYARRAYAALAAQPDAALIAGRVAFPAADRPEPTP